MSRESAASTSATGETTHDQPTSERVVRAVAKREAVDATELDPPLFEAVQPDALDSLFDGRDTDGRVEFQWLGYRIVVFSSGSIRIIEDGDVPE